MSSENLLGRPENTVEPIHENGVSTPLWMIRDSSGVFTVTFSVSDENDPRVSLWEVSLWPNEDDDKTLTIESMHLCGDVSESTAWKVDTLTLFPNMGETLYEVMCDQEDTKTEKVVFMLEGIRKGVEEYTKYKLLSPEEREQCVGYVYDEFGKEFSKDTAWHRINYIFGVWKKEREEKKQDIA